MKKSKKIFLALFAIYVLALVELFSFIAIRYYDRKNHLRKISLSDESLEHFDEFIRGGMFDADLGWQMERDGRPCVIRNKEVHNGPPYFCSAYGDSFTWCDNVRDDQSWEEVFRGRYGKEILNFGVGAYGTDQAFLKMLKYYDRYPSRIVILGIWPENICRLVSVVRKFYFVDDKIPLVKPRYILDGEGKNTLLENPVHNVRELKNLGDPTFLRSISQNDYWYNAALKAHGCDLISGRRFPFSIELARTLFSILSGEDAGYSDRTRYFYEHFDSEPFMILRNIISDFADYGKDKEFIPMILIHAKEDYVKKNLNVSEPLTNWISTKGILCLDAFNVFSKAAGQDKIDEFFIGHYSAKGNELLADALHDFFLKNGLK